MAAIASEITALAGERSPRRLLDDTRRLAEFCVLDPQAHLGLGEVFVPELDVLLGEPVAPTEADARATAASNVALGTHQP